MPIDQKLLLAAIDNGRENSYGTDEQSSLGKRRAAAIEAYLGLNTRPAPEGRSQVVDRSVYETISTLMPSLVRIFAASSEDICKFTPVGPEDEAGAEQTTAAVNHVVTQQNGWEQICGDWLLDSMLLCNGYCMPYWDETSETVRETYKGQSDDQLAALVQDGVTVVQHTQYVDDEMTREAQGAYQQAMQQWQMAASQASVQGQPPPPPPQDPGQVMLHDVVIDRTDTSGKVCIQVLPPEHCFVHVDTPDWTLKNCPYFEVRLEKSISELKAMGLEIPAGVSDSEDDDDDTTEDAARNRFGEADYGDDDDTERKVWTRMIWVRASAEGDGVSRLYYVIAIGKTILFSEQCSRIPVASMTPQPMPHRHIGMSVAETVLDLQEVKTAVTRGALDNLYLANNGRHVISSRVNMADFLDARPGGVVRMLDDSVPGEGHVMPLTHPFAFDSIVGSLEYFDQVRQNRTGASRYFSGTDANAINKTASGTIALQNMAAMRVEHIARVMAPAVEYLFEVVHELLSKHRTKPLILKLKGQWTTVDPLAWATKRDVRISVGVGAGNKESMMQQLQGVLGAQMQIGLPLGLVGRDQIHATNTEILKLAGFSNPAKFWPDPRTLPPPQPQQSPEQMKIQADAQKEQFKAQQEQQRFQAEQAMETQRMQHQAALDQHREEMQARQKLLEMEQSAQLERMKAEQQGQFEAQRLEFERWKAELDSATKLALADKSAQASLETTQMTTTSDSRLDELVQTIRVLRAEADSPAELVRDPQTGRAIAVKRGDKERKIVRGPDGRAIGLQ